MPSFSGLPFAVTAPMPTTISPSAVRITRKRGPNNSSPVGAMSPRSSARRLNCTDISGTDAATSPSLSTTSSPTARKSNVRSKPAQVRTVSCRRTWTSLGPPLSDSST